MEKGRGKGMDTLQTDNVFTRKEYIEREAALDCFACDLGKKDYSVSYQGFMTEAAFRINAIPAADVVPVRHGRWVWDKDGMDWGIGAWRCSACRAMSPMWWNTDKTNPRTKSGHRYCPNCGARMDGDGE